MNMEITGAGGKREGGQVFTEREGGLVFFFSINKKQA